MANVYNTGIESLCDGTIVWGTSDMKVMMTTSSYSFVAEHDFRDDVTNEITNSGYSTGGSTLAGEATILDDSGDEVQLDATDLCFSGLGSGDQPDKAIVYKNVGAASTDQLLCCCTLTSPPAPNGGDYTIVWNAEGCMEVSNA